MPTPPDLPTVDLKNPYLAAFLAWCVPGLGHWYQGRKFKAAVFGSCILGVFLLGAYLGSSAKHGIARVVYYDTIVPSNRMFHFVCQAGAGLVTAPAMYQAWLFKSGKPPLFGSKMMAPLEYDFNPRRPEPPSRFSELNEVHLELARYFDIATAYTMIAGLLNVFAIFDALSGPVVILDEKEEANPKDDPAPEPAKSGA